MKPKMHKAVLAVVCCAGTTGILKADSLFNYNVVVTGQYSNTGSGDVQGRTFVNNFSVTNQVTFAPNAVAGTEDTLDVAGTIANSGGATIQNGVFLHTNALPGNFTVNHNSGHPDQTIPVSITPLSQQMSSIAALYNSYSPANGTAVLSNNTLTITATGSGVAVVSVNASDLANSNEQINVNLGANVNSLIIQVLGNLTFASSEHLALAGGGSQKLLWDFENANTISLMDSTWLGSILAPGASLTNNNQTIEGGVYVANFTQTAEVHTPANNPAGTPSFNGPVPVPSPAIYTGALALLVSVGLMRGLRFTNSIV